MPAPANESLERRYALRGRAVDLAFTASRVATLPGVKPQAVRAGGRYRRMVRVRSLPCYRAVRDLGVGISIPFLNLGSPKWTSVWERVPPFSLDSRYRAMLLLKRYLFSVQTCSLLLDNGS